MARSDRSSPSLQGRPVANPFFGTPARLLAISLGVALAAVAAAGGLALHGGTPPAAAATTAITATATPVTSLSFRTTGAAPVTTAQPRRAADSTSTPAPTRATVPSRAAAPAQPATAPPAPTSPTPTAVPSAQPQPSAAPAPLALATPATPARDSASALSAAANQPILEREHLVQSGETLSAIAQKWGVSTETLVINNAGVTDRDMLKIGQKLRVPPRDGLLYELRLGESIGLIANRYGVDAEAIVKEPANRLTSPDMVQEGQMVFVPGARVPQPAPLVAITAAPSPVQIATAAAGAATPNQARTPATAVATAIQTATGYRWPIAGPLSSYFGPSHPLGIDIDLYGRDGEPIRAARSGVVTFAGGNPCCSYGYYVEMDHGDGMRTLYAHFNSPPPVRIGQTISQGQVVGYAGTTGYSTGTHLHFEIRRAGVPLNPLSYLP